VHAKIVLPISSIYSARDLKVLMVIVLATVIDNSEPMTVTQIC